MSDKPLCERCFKYKTRVFRDRENLRDFLDELDISLKSEKEILDAFNKNGSVRVFFCKTKKKASLIPNNRIKRCQEFRP